MVMNIIYGVTFVKLPFKIRFVWTVGLTLSGILWMYLGFRFKLLGAIYLGSWFLGTASTISMISMMSFLNYFPEKDYKVFLSFSIVGSCLMTVIFMGLDSYGFFVYNVILSVT